MATASEAAAVLFQEARLLDGGAWEDWLGMYQPDAVYWAPAWRDEYEPTEDPDTEVSLIYHDSRRGLEERVARIESRKSITALPLPRTVHVIANVEADAAAPDRIETRSTFAVHVYDVRAAKEHTRHGRYEHTLTQVDGRWLIARKKIILVNDRVPAVLDFYSI
jgi:benzoate/toluate 1,2-dioxygenase beta subunit/2,4,5-trichlorophenoxyacetic acid oxygenase 2